MSEVKNTRKKKRKVNYVKFFIIFFSFVVFLLGASGGALFYVMTKDMPTWDDSKVKQGSVTSTIYDGAGKVVTQIHGIEDREPVEIEQVPLKVRQAFLAVEDVRFYEHKGVDFRAVARAVVTNFLGGGKYQGASTLTQQIIKNTYFNSKKTYTRKAQEMLLALEMERKYSKDEIFEIYLNRVPFGHNAMGVQAAAKTYFNKDVAKLSLDEAALIAGLPKAPSKYSPFNNPEGAKQRRNVVLANMFKYGFITQQEYTVNVAKELKLTPNRTSKYKHPYFIEYVLDEFSEKEELKPFQDKLYDGGLKIYTTMDERIQTSTEEIMSVKKNYPYARKEKVSGKVDRPQGAAVIIDQENGNLKALVGGREHTAMRGLNRVKVARQPGSSFKPLIAYGPAVEKGLGSGSVELDTRVSFGGYTPKNYGNSYDGPITLKYALQKSKNMIALKLLNKFGISNAHKFVNNLGFNLGKNDKKLGIALGDVEATPIQMAGAYAAFANEGIYTEPVAILRIEDQYGNMLYENKPQKKRAMKASTASIMIDMMKNVVRAGTATRAQVSGWEVAGKTGTTDDGKDIWFVGYTPRLTAAVWMGYDHPTPMKSEFGGEKPAAMWSKIMKSALKGYNKDNFNKASNVYRTSVCTISGKRPGPNCPSEAIRSELFSRGHGPSGTCDLHIEVEIDPVSGKLATADCLKKEKRVFVKIPADWKWTPGPKSTIKVAPTEKCTEHKGGKPATDPNTKPNPDGNQEPGDSTDPTDPNNNNTNIPPTIPPVTGTSSGTGTSTNKSKT